jgi:hypothetical protein
LIPINTIHSFVCQTIKSCDNLALKHFMPTHPPIYHPREPTDSTLWKILHHHYEDSKAGYGEDCEKQYGFFRPVVIEVVEEYLRCGAQVQNWMVLIKVALIVAFVSLAFPQLTPTADETCPPFSISAFGVSLVWISFSYSGWNAAVYIGSKVRDPKRNLPRSLILGTVLVTVLYLYSLRLKCFFFDLTTKTPRHQENPFVSLCLGG